jgi:lysophospholipase L1-like esterase
MDPYVKPGRQGTTRSLWAGSAVIAILWLAVFAMGAIVVYEAIPLIRSKPTSNLNEKSAFLIDKYYRLANTSKHPYAAFHVQHLHPTYLFFFSLDPEKRRAISNQIVSLSKEGFRGSDPIAGKPLAVILGGSAAFGDGASSDESTIAGYLNKLQDSVHFVNAGVPSWNSTQELHRLADQIVPLNPTLVMSCSFSNDIVVALEYAKKRMAYPPGAPESFDLLTTLVDDIRASASIGLSRSFFVEVFPRTSALATRVFSRKRYEAPPAATKEELLNAVETATDRFVWNQIVMRAIADGRKFRFVTVIQPMLRTHANVAASDRNDDQDWWLFEHAVRRVMSTDYCQKNCLDYSNIFDAKFREIPVLRQPEARDPKALIFIDRVHLFDSGNEYVAQRLVQDLKPLPVRNGDNPIGKSP